MKHQLHQLMTVGLLLLATATASAYNKDMYPYELPAGKNGAGLGCEKAVAGMELELGKWYTNFQVCKDYADKHELPMFAIWGNATCIHCWYTEVVFIQDAFKEWQQTHDAAKVILCYMAGGHDDVDQVGSTAYNWMWKTGGTKLTAYPFTVFWWKKAGVNVRMTGDDLCKGTKSSALSFSDATIPTRVQNVIAAFEKYFKDWKPSTYAGGTFAEESDYDRVEWDQGASSVLVTLNREDAAGEVATNATLRIKGANGAVVATQSVNWTAGQTTQAVTVNLTKSWYQAGSQLTLEMLDDQGEVQSTTHIAMVEREVSAACPLWIGEKTQTSLGWGEWTMDLAVATQKVAEASGDAYTLVLVAGSLWCPDCYNVDHYFLGVEDEGGNNRFAQWAAAHKVACVMIDVPPLSNGTVTEPTILSRTVGTGYFDKDGQFGMISKSGNGYLSRKGVSDADAQAILERNIRLASTNTAFGGFHRPEDSNLYRTGVPIFVLLRKDGTVAARLTQWASASPEAEDVAKFDDYLKRFDELLAIAGPGAHADAGEIENNAPGTGAITFKANGGTAAGEISHCDFQDVFKLEGVGGNARQQVTVTGSTDAEVLVSYLKLKADGSNETLSASIGKLNDEGGVACEYTFQEPGDYYVKVSGQDISDDAFAIDSTTADNFHPFTISGDVLFIPTTAQATGNAPETSNQVKVRLEADKLYRILGLDATACASALTADPKYEGFYTAVISGDCYLTLAGGNGAEFSYQLWEPGTVGFTAASAIIPETIGATKFTVKRTGGISGAVKVRVAVDTEATTAYDYWGEPRFEFADTEFMMLEGEEFTTNLTIAVKNDEFFDGDAEVVLKLSVVDEAHGDVALGTSVYTLTIKEDEKQDAGIAAIVGAEPFFAKSKTIYAKASKTAKIRLGRLNANDGRVAIKVTASDKNVLLLGLDESFQDYDMLGYGGWQYWNNRDDGTKTIVVSKLPAAGKSVKVTLAQITKDTRYDGGDFKVLSASNTVTIVSVADEGPEFATASDALTLYRYVATSTSYPLAAAPAGNVTFTKLAGTLPAGLKVAYDAVANALALTGVPTAAAGIYTVTYQAKDGSKAGLVKELVLTIVDPTDAKKSESVNPYVAASRTIADIPLEDRSDYPYALAGTVQVTIPTKGNLSARATLASGTVSFSTKNWSEFDAATGDLTAVLTASKGHVLTVKVSGADGSLDLELVDPAAPAVALVGEHDGKVWSKTDTAEAWQGYYTVATPVTKVVAEETADLAPTGIGYLTLKFESASVWKTGKVTWAGLMPNGTAVSGSTVLKRDGDAALLPIFKYSTADVYALPLEIAQGALAAAQDDSDRHAVVLPSKLKASWRHQERIAEAKGGYELELDACGAIYDKTEDLGGCCSDYYHTNELALAFDTSLLKSTAYGEVQPVGSASVTVGAATVKLATGAPTGMTLSFNRSTGIVTGNVRISYGEAGKYLTASWKGVVLTGWGDKCGCNPGPFMPFVNGSFYFTDRISYVPSTGKSVRTLSVKRGGKVKAE